MLLPNSIKPVADQHAGNVSQKFSKRPRGHCPAYAGSYVEKNEQTDACARAGIEEY